MNINWINWNEARRMEFVFSSQRAYNPVFGGQPDMGYNTRCCKRFDINVFKPRDLPVQLPGGQPYSNMLHITTGSHFF